MSNPSRDLVDEHLLDVVEPICVEQGFDLEALEVTAVGRRHRVNVVVDADGGVDLDQCATLSHALSAAMDATDVLGDAPYTLEVSSPGVARPLRLPRHWRMLASKAGLGTPCRTTMHSHGS